MSRLINLAIALLFATSLTHAQPAAPVAGPGVDEGAEAPVDTVDLGNQDRASTILEEVKLNLAAVSWNEGTSDVTRDEVRAIWQVQWSNAGGTRASVEDILRSQRALSSRVTQESEPRNIGNEVWTRHLRWNSVEPVGWNQNQWEPRYARKWDRHRAYIDRLIDRHLAGQPQRQCSTGIPRGWGGPEVDAGLLERRNARRVSRRLRPFAVLDCGSTRNVFFGVPRQRHLIQRE